MTEQEAKPAVDISERFTNQKPRRATAEELKMPWSGGRNGKYFRCCLCGHRFQVGDYWRWVYAADDGMINFKVCESCDGPGVKERWKQHWHDYKAMCEKFWVFMKGDE